MILKIKGEVVAMSVSHFNENSFDVLLAVQNVDGSQRLKSKLLSKRLVFEGVHTNKPFFVGDTISLCYRDELGPRYFDVIQQPEYSTFTDVLLVEKNVVEI